MHSIGIVGHESAKFSRPIEMLARRVIREIVGRYDDIDESLTVVSGACHLGGADIWAIEEARKLGVAATVEFPPKEHAWWAYRERNLKIVEASDVVHVIVVAALPPGFKGMRFPMCYHCKTTEHIKSGACWTARQALKVGKKAEWHVL